MANTSTRANLQQAATLNTLRDRGVVIMQHGGAGMFLAVANRKGVSHADMTKMLRKEVKAQGGLRVEILAETMNGCGLLMVQFLLTVAPEVKPAASAEEPVNVERVEVDGVVVSHPANLTLEPKLKRLQHMARFVASGGAFIRIDQPGLEKAFVDRLFREGLLERSVGDTRQMRATNGGRKWFRLNESRMQAE